MVHLLILNERFPFEFEWEYLVGVDTLELADNDPQGRDALVGILEPLVVYVYIRLDCPLGVLPTDLRPPHEDAGEGIGLRLQLSSL